MFEKPVIYSDIEVLKSLAQGYLDRIMDPGGVQKPDFIASLLHHSYLFINCSDDELDALLESVGTDKPDEFGTFCDAFDIGPMTNEIVFDAIAVDERQIVNQSGSLFFLNRTKAETKRLREEYGVWVLNGEEITEDVFKFTYNNDYDPNEKRPPCDNGWTEELKGICFPVCNSIVISDDYLVSNRKDDMYIGLCNLTMLFDAILPKSNLLKVPFYISVFTNPNPKDKNPKDEVMISRIKDWIDNEVKPLRDYQIVVEVVFTKKALHDRRLLTLHYSIDPDKGFHVFLPQSNCIYKDGNDINKVRVESYYTNYGNPFVKGKSLYEMAYRDTCQLMRFYENAYDNYINKHNEEGVDKMAGDVPTSKKSKNCVLN